MIDFPASPVDAQVFSAANGVVYQYSAAQTAWLAQTPPPVLGGTGEVTAWIGGFVPSNGVDVVFVPNTVTAGNSGLWLNTTNGRYTPPAGKYFLQCIATLQAPAGGNGTWELAVRKNGTRIAGLGGSGSGSVSFLVPITVGEYVDANGADYFEFVGKAFTAGMAFNSGSFSAFPLTGMRGPTGGPPGTVVGDFFATMSTGSSLTNAFVTQLFNSVVTGNSGAYYNSANGRYTPPAGRYKIFATVTGFNAAGATAMSVALRKNGVTMIASQQVPGAAGWAGDPCVEAVVDANGTDFFDIQATANNGAQISPNQAWFGAYPIQGMVGPQGPAGPANPTNVFRNYMSGFVHSNPGLSNGLFVGPGQAADSTNTVWITLTSGMTKTLTAPWGAANNAGGMGNGITVAPNTWYWPFAIINGGSPNIYFDNTYLGVNAPAGTTAQRRLRAFKTDGSSQVVAHQGKGDTILWNNAIVDYATFPPALANVSVPPGVSVQWLGVVNLVTANTGLSATITLTDYGVTNSGFTIAAGAAGTNTGAMTGTQVAVWTNTNAQLAYAGAGSGVGFNMSTRGWIDDCGRYD